MTKQIIDSSPVPTLRRVLGERAFAASLILARKSMAPLKGEITEVAKEFKRNKVSIKATGKKINDLVSFIRQAREKKAFDLQKKRANQITTGLGGIVTNSSPGIKAYILPKMPIAERLEQYKSKIAANRIKPLKIALENALGHVSHSAPTFISQTAIALSEVNSRVNSCQDGYYSGSTKWPLIRHQIVANVRADWPESVAAKGLASIHGIVTLAAQSVENEREGEEIFRAIWVRKGQGAKLIREEGYIIRRGAEVAHGQTIAGTRAVLTRRETEKKLDRIEGEILRRLENNQLNGASDLLVTVGDSLRAGNCEPGTLAFRDKHFPDRESATVKEVLGVANSFGDRRFAIAACVKALRRHQYCPAVVN